MGRIQQSMAATTQITKGTPQEEIIGLAPACQCSQCRHGCRMGSGFFAEGEEEKLARFLSTSVEGLKEKYLEEAEQFGRKLLRPRILRKEKPYGQCTFFDEEKGCTVHEAKPLQCRVAMGCGSYGEELMLWFMLNHIVDANNPESVRQYAAYLKTGGRTLPGGELESLVPDKEKLGKMLDYTIIKIAEDEDNAN